MLTWEKSADRISIVFKVNLVWWDVGQVFEPSSGAFAFFSVERRQLLSNADGVQSQLLSSGDKKGKKRENNPQSLWLIWQHHLKYSIYHRLAMSDRFSTAIQLKCVGGRRKHFKKRDLQSGVSDCREGRGGGWAQVRANLQSNKLDARAPENHFGTTESWAVVPGPWTNLQQPPNLGIISVPALHLVLLLHQKALDQTLIEFTCSWRPSSSKPCI